MRTGVFSLISAVIAAGFLFSAADARPMRDRQSLDQILPQIRQQHPGTLYDADGPFIGPDGRQHYRLKWMTPEGRVQWLDADARSGRVTNAQGGREPFDDERGGNSDRYDGDRYRNSDGNRSDNGNANNGNRNKERRNRYNTDGAFDDPFDNGDRNNSERSQRRNNDNGDWNNNGGNRDWEPGNRGNNGNSGGWQNNNGGGHRHRGH